MTALSVFLDGQSVEIAGAEPPWQWIALVAFTIFVALVAWQQWDMHRQIHSPEHQVDVTIRPDPIRDNDWFFLQRFLDQPGLCSLQTYFFVDLRVTDGVSRTVNEIYIEMWAARRWRKPLRRIPYRRLTPTHVNTDMGWYRRTIPSRVDWGLDFRGATQIYRLAFDDQWNDPDIAGNGKFDVYLVLEVGGRRHRRKIDLLVEGARGVTTESQSA